MLTGYKDKKIAFIGSIKDKTILPKLHGILADYTFECIEVKRTGLKRMLADTAYSGYVLTAPLKSAAPAISAGRFEAVSSSFKMTAERSPASKSADSRRSRVSRSTESKNSAASYSGT